MCSCRSTTWTWDWVWLYDWFVFFFWSHPFPFQKRGKQPLKLTTWFLVVCFSHKITPWSQPRHLFTTLYLDVSIPALGAHTRQRKRMDHLWRWRFVVYGYQMILDDMDIDGWNRWWKVKACYESSLTKHLPHRFALTGLVWSWHLLNISRFSILWICWWRDFSRSWMWFRSVAPCRIVISISGALHFLFSYLFIPSIWILYINRMNEFEREYLDVRDRAAASFQEWQEIVDEWKKGLLTRRILFCSQDGMCVFSIIFPFLFVLFVDLRRLEDLGNELVELRKKDRQMRQMMDEKVALKALGFVGWERVVTVVGCTEKIEKQK